MLADDNDGPRHQYFIVEYIWNSQGGLIHWTHRDPSEKIQGGRLYYRGKYYR